MGAWLHLSPFTKITYILTSPLPFQSSFLRATWEAISQTTVLIRPQINLTHNSHTVHVFQSRRLNPKLLLPYTFLPLKTTEFFPLVFDTTENIRKYLPRLTILKGGNMFLSKFDRCKAEQWTFGQLGMWPPAGTIPSSLCSTRKWKGPLWQFTTAYD